MSFNISIDCRVVKEAISGENTSLVITLDIENQRHVLLCGIHYNTI